MMVRICVAHHWCCPVFDIASECSSAGAALDRSAVGRSEGGELCSAAPSSSPTRPSRPSSCVICPDGTDHFRFDIEEEDVSDVSSLSSLKADEFYRHKQRLGSLQALALWKRVTSQCKLAACLRSRALERLSRRLLTSPFFWRWAHLHDCLSVLRCANGLLPPGVPPVSVEEAVSKLGAFVPSRWRPSVFHSIAP